MQTVFMTLRGYVYIIQVPLEYKRQEEVYDYCREKLGAGNDDITVWHRADFFDDVARFDYKLG